MSLSSVIDRQLRTKGRPMVLKRRVGTGTTFTSATVRGFLVAFSPQDITGEVRQGDARVTIGSDTGALGVVRANDILTIDGQDWQVLGATPRHVGATLAGYTVWVRGGGA
jgi:hypothetical protein